MDFDKLVDLELTFHFYGVCNNQFKLDSNVYEAMEDPDDGYRSYMESVEVVDSDGIFFDTPISTVKIEGADSIEGYRLIDIEDGHVWLEFGTEDWGGWYPYFVFNYEPKAPKE
ncbi:MAG TPA: hypothetical protein VIM70_06060 [Clostridium sp.]|uniref:hypothetical protein n=1 Tax=Clostridium sp. TaxID=1506 RepID=UPI002F93B76B